MRANKKPVNKFKMLLAILTAIAILIVVLLVSAFGMLKWAAEYGIVNVPGGQISLDNLSEIDIGQVEFAGGEYYEMSAIESIQMENFMN